jgi:flagellar basal-body rod protein FlgB
MELFNKTFGILSSMADFHARRHKVIVSNIANMDVADYESKDITFRKELAGALGKEHGVELAKTNAMHLPGSTGAGNYDVVTSGNKVLIDREMANLAENQLMYNLTIELLARKFRGLSTVLREVK